jgi:hypothetical protein
MDIISKISAKIKEKKECLFKPLPTNPPKTATTLFISTPINTEPAIIEIDDLLIPERELFTSSMINSSNNDDQNAQSIQIACYAYWKVFEKRFIDSYQVIILSKLVYFYQKNLALMLEKKFSPNSTKENFLMENLEVTKKRKDLDISIRNLEQALEELNLIL